MSASGHLIGNHKRRRYPNGVDKRVVRNRGSTPARSGIVSQDMIVDFLMAANVSCAKAPRR
jgi:hypothetical protein